MQSQGRSWRAEIPADVLGRETDVDEDVVVVELGLYGIYHDDALIERHLETN